jgi:hypothetical protein
MALLCGMTGLAPLNSLLLVAILVLFYQSQLIVLWRAVVESPSVTHFNLTVVPWQCKIITLITAFLVSSLVDLRQRQEYRIKHVLQELKDQHIKQLECEKECLTTQLSRQNGFGQEPYFTIDSTGLRGFNAIALTQSTISRRPRSE